jgi:hypothetical protein
MADIKSMGLFLVMVLAVALLFVAVNQPVIDRMSATTAALDNIRGSLHADLKHGGEAQIVRDCLNQVGPTLKMYNPSSHRNALVCQIDTNLFGVRILDEKEVNEVTAFVKNKFHNLEQVIQYLINGGYQ